MESTVVERTSFQAGRALISTVEFLGCALFLALAFLSKGILAPVLAALCLAGFLRLSSGGGTRVQDVGSVFSLALFAALLSVMIVTAREAQGLVEVLPFRRIFTGEIPLELFRADAHQSVYEKHDIKAAVGEFALFFMLVSLVALEWARACSLRLGKPAGFHPASALFAIVLFFSSFQLPPYDLDLPHWTPFLSSAAEIITGGRWPYLHHYSVQYGFLDMGALALWLSAFKLTPFTLAGFVYLLTALSGALAYLLVKRTTGSKWAAFAAASVLAAACYDIKAALLVPNTGAFRSTFPIMAGLFLLWTALGPGKAARYAASILFGALVLWEPVFGAFMALAFLTVKAYRFLILRDRAALSCALFMSLGIILPLAAITGARAPEIDLFSAGEYRVLFSNHRFFMEGFGTAPQKFFASELLVFLYLSILTAASWRRAAAGRAFTKKYQFMFAAVVMSPPWIAYELGNSNPSYVNPMLWLFAPGIALVLVTWWRLAKRKSGARTAYAVTLLAAAPLVPLTPVAPFKALVTEYLTKNEEARAAWYRDCAVAIKNGGSCDPKTQPGLPLYFRQALEPGLGLGSLEGEEFRYSPANALLAKACRKGIPVISNLDGVVFMQSGCAPGHRFPSTQHLTGKTVLSAYLDAIKGYPVIVFDERRFSQYYTRELFSNVKAEILASGYRVAERYGVISVLSRQGGLRGADCLVCMEGSRVSVLDEKGKNWNGADGSVLRKKLLEGPSLGSFILTAEVRTSGDAAGLMFAAKSEEDYYVFYLNPETGGSVLGRYQGPGKHKDLFNVPVNGLADREKWHRVEIVGDKSGYFQFFIDDAFIAEYTGIEALGDIGLWDWGGKAEFRAIEVRESPDLNKA